MSTLVVVQVVFANVCADVCVEGDGEVCGGRTAAGMILDGPVVLVFLGEPDQDTRRGQGIDNGGSECEGVFHIDFMEDVIRVGELD